MHIYELRPIRREKSFYGKAVVIDTGKIRLLRSYNTIVAYFDKKGRLHRTWDGWSMTTARHVDAFNGGGIGKSEWLEMKVEKIPAY